MSQIETHILDVTGCNSSTALWGLLLGVLRAVDGHGRNLDALWDGVTSTGLIGLQPPYRIAVVGTEELPREVFELLVRIGTVFRDARREGVDARLEISLDSSRTPVPTSVASEVGAGRVAFWLAPDDLAFLARVGSDEHTVYEVDSERWARIRFRASAALHKSGWKRDPDDA